MDFIKLSNFLDRITQWRIPGADCAVYYDNRLVFRHCAGYADMEQKTPLTEDNLYFLYSTSKVITCVAALQLFEQGRFLMSDPLGEYLPEYGQMDVLKPRVDGGADRVRAQSSITIRDLFTMTAGLTYDLNSPSIRAAKEKTQGRCPTREIIRAIAQEPLLFEPGTHFNYSLCHDVLAALVEVLSGMKFSQYLEENIFAPLGMKDTGLVLTEEKAARMASQYNFSDEKDVAEKIGLTNDYVIGSEYESGGAGIISSVGDYALFANTLCQGGRAPRSERILSTRTIDLMRTNHLSPACLADFIWIQMRGYGYGLGVRTLMDKAQSGSLSPIGEFGWGGAAGTYAMMDPENKLAVFYGQHMLNNQEPYVHPRLRNIVYRCLDA